METKKEVIVGGQNFMNTLQARIAKNKGRKNLKHFIIALPLGLLFLLAMCVITSY